MSREIKFRGWSLETETMIYPDKNGWYTDVFRHANGYLQTVQLATVVKDERLVALQFTGLKDKNGKEIFEGDIVECKSWRSKFVVVFEYGMFRCRNIEKGREESKVSLATFKGEVSCEIIGNIYENPELLEESA